eukprot:6807321-Alexandrium_andersonii.AAC.1
MGGLTLLGGATPMDGTTPMCGATPMCCAQGKTTPMCGAMPMGKTTPVGNDGATTLDSGCSTAATCH